MGGSDVEPEQYKPRLYQKKAIKFLLSKPYGGLFLDPGLGKTSISLYTILTLLHNGLIENALIVAPLRVVYSVWPNEIKKWKDFNNLTYTILHDKDKNKNIKKDVNIYIINPEGLEWFEKQNFTPDALFVDESSKFKRTNSKRFKIMRRLVPKFKRRYILTGSPAPNGLINLFGQVYIMDQGQSLGKYITQYRRNYFYPSGYGGYEWTIQPGADERIYNQIGHLVLRMDAKDYLDLPELIFNEVPITLPKGAWDVYKELETAMISNFDGHSIVAANAAVASQKCRQVSNGGIYVDKQGNFLDEDFTPTSKADRTTLELHTEKAEAVAEIIDELQGSPALVAYEFQHDLERLRQVLGKNTPHIGKGVNPKQSEKIIQRWNAGDIPVLLGQPTSMSHGLNMQDSGYTVIFHSLIWDLEAYDQFIKRVWRSGQKNRVTVHHIVSNTLIDRIILQTLKKKDRVQQDLFKALKAMAA